MKYFDWDDEKNERLKKERDISFEEVIIEIFEGNILADVKHPNKVRYPNQRMFIVEIDNYAYLVPYIEDKEKVFLKTVMPSRKATKKYLINNLINKG